jgi:uncharacterized alkaline shock family protein YloU
MCEEGKCASEYTEIAGEQDTIRIASEVVTQIAGISAAEVEGLAAMSGGIVNGLTERLGRKDLAKGVKVEVGEKEAEIDLSIIVEYGAKIQEVAKKAQDAVRTAVQTMTGLKVTAVRVHVQGINIPREPVEKEKEQEK